MDVVDGWNGALLTVTSCDSVEVLVTGIVDGYTATDEFCLPTTDLGFVVTVSSGSYPTEVSWTIVDSSLATVLQGSGDSTAVTDGGCSVSPTQSPTPKPTELPTSACGAGEEQYTLTMTDSTNSKSRGSELAIKMKR